MAKKQLDKLVANEVHSLVEFKLNREHLLLEFLMKESAIDMAPSEVTLQDGDSLPMLNSSQLTPRSVSWGKTVVTDGKLVSIGGAIISTDLSIANKTATTLDILSSSGDDITVPAVTTALAGLMTAPSLVKLNSIEPYADVTDKENVGASILAATSKSALSNTDYIAILDSANGNVLSRVLLSNIITTGYTVNQTDHGFSIGETIKPSETVWIRTKADSTTNAGTVGVVSDIISTNSFRYITAGILPGSYTIGANYFLSTTTFGGLMVVIGDETWTVGQVMEYIGTGVEGGLQVQIDGGQEISSTLVVDKYVKKVTFDNNTRILSLERTDGLSTLTATIPQYVEADTLSTVLARGNSSALGATFGAMVTAPTFALESGYTISKVSNKMVISAPTQLDVDINNLSVIQVTAGGFTNIGGTLTVPSMKITSGAVAGYVWKCTSSDGLGAWSSVTASNIYKGAWNANTNTPTLVDGNGTAGWYYRVTVAGTFSGTAYSVGDDVMYNGSVWQRIPSAGFVFQPATSDVLGGVMIGDGITVLLDGTISVSTNYQPPLEGIGLVYSAAGVISYDTTTYAPQAWVTTNFASLGHIHDYVPLVRNIDTIHSITGGGDLSNDMTLALVNDVVSPGNHYMYGTNGSGTRGWQKYFWLSAGRGAYYPNGFIAIGNVNPVAPLHVDYYLEDQFISVLVNSSDTGGGISVLSDGISLEIKDKNNVGYPAFQIYGDGTIKWQRATSGTGDKIIYYDSITKRLFVGNPGETGLTLHSLSAFAPILYDDTTGIFSMEANAYAPYGTVSFPGFGTDHITAAYGDHTHSYEPGLGNPPVDGYFLSSTTAGVRSWVMNSSGIPDAPADSKLYGRKNNTWAEVVIPADNTIVVRIDFQSLTAFVYTCPVALVFNTQTSQGTAATLSVALNTNMAAFQQLTVTPTALGLVTLTGVQL